MYMCICTYFFPVSSSVTDAAATLVTPKENRTLHSITVNCTVRPDSTADMCVVMASSNDQATRIDNKYGHAILRTYNILYVHTIRYICIYILIW